MGRTLIETVMGAVVLVVAAVFIFFAYNMAEVKAVTGYEVKAAFLKIGGLQKGADVRISGIKVGTVMDQSLDTQTFDAVVTMSISPTVKLPVDSVATIASDGMLGGKYLQILPGGAKEYVVAGGMLEKTKDYRSLEDQVGEIIFLATGGDSEGH